MTPKLLAGPYLAPACSRGDWIADVVDGLTEVGGWTSAPLPWPRRKKTGRASLILTDELARAVREESEEAICYWWGVGVVKVWQWRKALGVGRITPGTRDLLRERTGVPPAAAARGRAAAAQPEVRERMAATKRGRPAHPRTAEALLQYAKGPRIEPPTEPTSGRRWSDRDDAFLRRWHGKITNQEIAARLGRTACSVESRISEKGWSLRHEWTEADDDALREHYPSGDVARIAAVLDRSVYALRRRAQDLGVRRNSVVGGSRPTWTPQQDAVLRSMYANHDAAAIAEAVGRTVKGVYTRAIKLGLQTPNARARHAR